ncbi:hypothetical protein AB833_29845 [Chromatiales bacterium (ex Bugula neritina AB1)]|nr:hypothetical protein AB833_29845 [Chromatiales bacterium (ex Bugula neritina AB1)]
MNRSDGLVVVVPKDFDRSLLPDILTSRQGWIDRQLERFESLPGRFEQDWPPAGIEFNGSGESFRIRYENTAAAQPDIRRQGNELTVELPEASTDEELVALLVRWMKRYAQEYCDCLASQLSVQTGLRFNKVVVRGQKTRWGSFSSRGTLSLNYKLLFLPEPLLRHVILHELAHSVHMDHSKAFWALLENIDPNSRVHDRQLSEGWKYLPTWLE